MSDNDTIPQVLGSEYKKPFALIAALAAAAALILFGVSSVEKFVDGRIELKLSDQKRQQEEQRKRLDQIETQFSAMKDTLFEIRADVRVLRARFERDGK